MLGKADIYTILDCHQDVWSPKFCGKHIILVVVCDILSIICSVCVHVVRAGEGAPDYAALYENRTAKPLRFPTPIPTLRPYKVDPNTG